MQHMRIHAAHAYTCSTYIHVHVRMSILLQRLIVVSCLTKTIVFISVAKLVPSYVYTVDLVTFFQSPEEGREGGGEPKVLRRRGRERGGEGEGRGGRG